MRSRGLWKIMAKFEWPGKLNTMVRQFYDGMTARALDDSDCSIAVSNGVNQLQWGVASTLFNMMFSAILTDAFRDSDHQIWNRRKDVQPTQTPSFHPSQ